MTEPFDHDALQLPRDLRELDAELSSIRYEERPSFGPELRAQLAERWATQPPPRTERIHYLAAAAIACVLLVGAAVPSARASLIRLFTQPVVDVGPPPADIPVVAVALEAEIVPEEREIPAAPVALAPPPVPVEPLPAQPPIPPQMLDRAQAEALLEEAYPQYLQRERIGGLVWLRLWVDTDGVAGLANVVRGSGFSDLDRAALEVAPKLRFAPAMQGGTPVATWIEFPVLFEPEEGDEHTLSPPPTEDPMRLPIVHPDDVWEYEQPLELSRLPEWGIDSDRILTEAEAALVDAIGDPIVRRSLGPVEAILSGMAPSGRTPTAWREAAGSVLEDAIERNPDNAAPLLALGRIRLRQGLRTDARILFERGLQTAIQAASPVSPAVVAELHVERAKLLRSSWLSVRGTGRVRASAFDRAACAQARSSGGAASGYASVERLIAWNYLCPAELSRVFDVAFEASDNGVVDLSLMMGSFRSAIRAVPGHRGANVGLLIALADERRWEDVLAGARRFARYSDGDPYALLLAGLALHRLDRVDEAALHFDEALERLPAAEADEIRDVGFVIDATQASEYRRLWGEERRAWEESFWRTMDRAPTTAVNERKVEHLSRTTYAMLRLGGVASDPGEVWVRFGGPNSVHVVDEGAGQLTEFWDYGSGPDITFVRWVASQTMDLTPEGRAYVDDLGKIFPPQ